MLTSLVVPFLVVLDALAVQGTQDFQVEGVMQIAQTSFPPTRQRVQIIQHGSQWAIREIMKTSVNESSFAGLPIPNAAVHMLSSDGTNIYYLSHCETNSLASTSFEHPDPMTNSLLGQIHQPGFPKWIWEPTMVILFYAYLSGEYLDEATNDLLDPIKLTPMDLTLLEDRPVRAIYKRISDSHSLPRDVAFLHDGKTTNFLFVASNFTNVSGIQLPMRVTVTRYDTVNGDRLQIYAFEASNIKNKAGPSSFRPELTSGAMVRDYRFSHGMAYVQGVDHGFLTNWPTEAEAKLRPDYEANKVDWELRRIHNLWR